MTPVEQKAHDIIAQLADQIARGWAAFLVAQHVHERRANKRINCAYYFFGAVEELSVETAILALSRLLIPRQDSITIQYLLNYAEQNPLSFNGTQRDIILKNVAEHREQLKSIEPLVVDVKEHRDKTIAHFDRLVINNPTALRTHPLDDQQVEDAFALLLKMVQVYAGYLTPSEDIQMESLTSGVVEDVEYLTLLIEKANTEP